MATARPLAARARRPSLDIFQPIYRLLTSVRVAVLFIAVLALLGLLGVAIPQVPAAVRGNPVATQQWLDGERSMFGPLTDPMQRLGLFDVFRAKWFLFALGWLVVNVTTCTFNRWSPTFRNVFKPPERVPDTFFERAHNRTTFAPVPVATAESTLRRARFKVRRREENGAMYLFADRYPWAQLGTFVSHLALVLFISGGLITRLTAFEAPLFAGEGTTSPVFAVSNPNQLQVRIDEAIGRFSSQGGPIDYRTRLTIFKNGKQVASGVTTVNKPLKYGGYRFHQVAYQPWGAELKIRDLTTGNTVFRETFALQDTTAAPSVTVSGASGQTLLADVIPPTDFLPTASGALVTVPGSGRTIWVGITPKGAKAWQLVAFDPQAGAQGGELRVDEGASGSLSGLRVRFDKVTLLPSSLGFGVGGDQELAELTTGPDGQPALTLIARNQPAIALAAGQPTTVGGYEYTFAGIRHFSGIAVKKDYGATFIWVATAMLLSGLALTFYVPRRRLWLKLTDERTQIAALTEKSGGFEKDMRNLATRLGVPVPREFEEER
ncbi:MAG: cytochrome c biogenesis protein ResB [Dehalococcoidia bacterium]|nr:cytochrome c biogenesis protein ResB [Dehalococcoidia bacterium]